ncbi:hypothetical protein A2995_00995 [Candidatus Nomurabacteria bacterium RIFCSPLOWO2_01_FULL_33_24]|uniref:Uncharacterized protein n=1 Tax=Candidatus Nomurabacteria bacterium RIFCSPLOWO2_01_FULL_33_24 TaxID=1801765 RepID=A0A1F6WZB2_9BACT|nr:MAG: hypothetical protein A2995_00995 [Candidatus Nomurabacteria bacterium RIFCSPLOWO2_01_FULL_33_24]
MSKKYIISYLVIFIFLFIFGFSLFTNQTLAAGAYGTLRGYAWSDNIGWISFSCLNDSSCVGSGWEVAMDDMTGELSGMAWSDNIGWINFNPDFSVDICPDQPTDPNDCKAKVELTPPINNVNFGKVTGWIRACKVYLTGCSGATESLTGAKLGGWDGWIELSGANHSSPDGTGNGGVTYKHIYKNSGSSTNENSFIGNAWGSNVFGWINFFSGSQGVKAKLRIPFLDLTIEKDQNLLPPPFGPANVVVVETGNQAVLNWRGRDLAKQSNYDACTAQADWPNPGNRRSSSGRRITTKVELDGTGYFSLELWKYLYDFYGGSNPWIYKAPLSSNNPALSANDAAKSLAKQVNDVWCPSYVCASSIRGDIILSSFYPNVDIQVTMSTNGGATAIVSPTNLKQKITFFAPIDLLNPEKSTFNLSLSGVSISSTNNNNINNVVIDLANKINSGSLKTLYFAETQGSDLIIYARYYDSWLGAAANIFKPATTVSIIPKIPTNSTSFSIVGDPIFETGESTGSLLSSGSNTTDLALIAVRGNAGHWLPSNFGITIGTETINTTWKNSSYGTTDDIKERIENNPTLNSLVEVKHLYDEILGISIILIETKTGNSFTVSNSTTGDAGEMDVISTVRKYTLSCPTLGSISSISRTVYAGVLDYVFSLGLKAESDDPYAYPSGKTTDLTVPSGAEAILTWDSDDDSLICESASSGVGSDWAGGNIGLGLGTSRNPYSPNPAIVLSQEVTLTGTSGTFNLNIIPTDTTLNSISVSENYDTNLSTTADNLAQAINSAGVSAIKATAHNGSNLSSKVFIDSSGSTSFTVSISGTGNMSLGKTEGETTGILINDGTATSTEKAILTVSGGTSGSSDKFGLKIDGNPIGPIFAQSSPESTAQMLVSYISSYIDNYASGMTVSREPGTSEIIIISTTPFTITDEGTEKDVNSNSPPNIEIGYTIVKKYTLICTNVDNNIFTETATITILPEPTSDLTARTKNTGGGFLPAVSVVSGADYSVLPDWMGGDDWGRLKWWGHNVDYSSCQAENSYTENSFQGREWDWSDPSYHGHKGSLTPVAGKQGIGTLKEVKIKLVSGIIGNNFNIRINDQSIIQLFDTSLKITADKLKDKINNIATNGEAFFVTASIDPTDADGKTIIITSSSTGSLFNIGDDGSSGTTQIIPTEAVNDGSLIFTTAATAILSGSNIGGEFKIKIKGITKSVTLGSTYPTLAQVATELARLITADIAGVSATAVDEIITIKSNSDIYDDTNSFNIDALDTSGGDAFISVESITTRLATITINGTSGTVVVEINGITSSVPWNTDKNTTAQDLAEKINEDNSGSAPSVSNSTFVSSVGATAEQNVVIINSFKTEIKKDILPLSGADISISSISAREKKIFLDKTSNLVTGSFKASLNKLSFTSPSPVSETINTKTLHQEAHNLGSNLTQSHSDVDFSSKYNVITLTSEINNSDAPLFEIIDGGSTVGAITIGTTVHSYQLSCEGISSTNFSTEDYSYVTILPAGKRINPSLTFTVERDPNPPASASDITINSGEIAKLVWSTTDMTSCDASGDWSNAINTSGFQLTSPLINNGIATDTEKAILTFSGYDSTFEITINNIYSVIKSSSTTADLAVDAMVLYINADPVLSPIVLASKDPLNPYVMILESVSGPFSVTDFNTSDAYRDGNIDIALVDTYEYILTCHDAGGNDYPESVTVTVLPKPSVSLIVDDPFSASPSTAVVYDGDDVILKWWAHNVKYNQCYGANNYGSFSDWWFNGFPSFHATKPPLDPSGIGTQATFQLENDGLTANTTVASATLSGTAGTFEIKINSQPINVSATGDLTADALSLKNEIDSLAITGLTTTQNGPVITLSSSTLFNIDSSSTSGGNAHIMIESIATKLGSITVNNSINLAFYGAIINGTPISVAFSPALSEGKIAKNLAIAINTNTSVNKKVIAHREGTTVIITALSVVGHIDFGPNNPATTTVSSLSDPTTRTKTITFTGGSSGDTFKVEINGSSYSYPLGPGETATEAALEIFNLISIAGTTTTLDGNKITITLNASNNSNTASAFTLTKSSTMTGDVTVGTKVREYNLNCLGVDGTTAYEEAYVTVLPIGIEPQTGITLTVESDNPNTQPSPSPAAYSDIIIPSGAEIDLEWVATDIDPGSCLASGDWTTTGSKADSGSETEGPLINDGTATDTEKAILTVEPSTTGGEYKIIFGIGGTDYTTNLVTSSFDKKVDTGFIVIEINNLGIPNLIASQPDPSAPLIEIISSSPFTIRQAVDSTGIANLAIALVKTFEYELSCNDSSGTPITPSEKVIVNVLPEADNDLSVKKSSDLVYRKAEAVSDGETIDIQWWAHNVNYDTCWAKNNYDARNTPPGDWQWTSAGFHATQPLLSPPGPGGNLNVPVENTGDGGLIKSDMNIMSVALSKSTGATGTFKLTVDFSNNFSVLSSVPDPIAELSDAIDSHSQYSASVSGSQIIIRKDSGNFLNVLDNSSGDVKLIIQPVQTQLGSVVVNSGTAGVEINGTVITGSDTSTLATNINNNSSVNQEVVATVVDGEIIISSLRIVDKSSLSNKITINPISSSRARKVTITNSLTNGSQKYGIEINGISISSLSWQTPILPFSDYAQDLANKINNDNSLNKYFTAKAEGADIYITLNSIDTNYNGSYFKLQKDITTSGDFVVGTVVHEYDLYCGGVPNSDSEVFDSAFVSVFPTGVEIGSSSGIFTVESDNPNTQPSPSPVAYPDIIIPSGAEALLKWSMGDMTSCQASGDWAAPMGTGPRGISSTFQRDIIFSGSGQFRIKINLPGQGYVTKSFASSAQAAHAFASDWDSLPNINAIANGEIVTLSGMGITPDVLTSTPTRVNLNDPWTEGESTGILINNGTQTVTKKAILTLSGNSGNYFGVIIEGTAVEVPFNNNFTDSYTALINKINDTFPGYITAVSTGTNTIEVSSSSSWFTITEKRPNPNPGSYYGYEGTIGGNLIINIALVDTYEYILTCQDVAGNNYPESVTVTVLPEPEVGLTVEGTITNVGPSSVVSISPNSAGERVRLKWWGNNVKYDTNNCRARNNDGDSNWIWQGPGYHATKVLPPFGLGAGSAETNNFLKNNGAGTSSVQLATVTIDDIGGTYEIEIDGSPISASESTKSAIANALRDAINSDPIVSELVTAISKNNVVIINSFPTKDTTSSSINSISVSTIDAYTKMLTLSGNATGSGDTWGIEVNGITKYQNPSDPSNLVNDASGLSTKLNTIPGIIAIPNGKTIKVNLESVATQAGTFDITTSSPKLTLGTVVKAYEVQCEGVPGTGGMIDKKEVYVTVLPEEEDTSGITFDVKSDDPDTKPSPNTPTDSIVIPSGAEAELTWEATDMSSCLATGNWSGNKNPLGGQETQGPLINDGTQAYTKKAIVTLSGGIEGIDLGTNDQFWLVINGNHFGPFLASGDTDSDAELIALFINDIQTTVPNLTATAFGSKIVITSPTPFSITDGADNFELNNGFYTDSYNPANMTIALIDTYKYILTCDGTPKEVTVDVLPDPYVNLTVEKTPSGPDTLINVPSGSEVDIRWWGGNVDYSTCVSTNNYGSSSDWNWTDPSWHATQNPLHPGPGLNTTGVLNNSGTIASNTLSASAQLYGTSGTFHLKINSNTYDKTVNNNLTLSASNLVSLINSNSGTTGINAISSGNIITVYSNSQFTIEDMTNNIVYGDNAKIIIQSSYTNLAGVVLSGNSGTFGLAINNNPISTPLIVPLSNSAINLANEINDPNNNVSNEVVAMAKNETVLINSFPVKDLSRDSMGFPTFRSTFSPTNSIFSRIITLTENSIFGGRFKVELNGATIDSVTYSGDLVADAETLTNEINYKKYSSGVTAVWNGNNTITITLDIKNTNNSKFIITNYGTTGDVQTLIGTKVFVYQTSCQGVSGLATEATEKTADQKAYVNVLPPTVPIVDIRADGKNSLSLPATGGLIKLTWKTRNIVSGSCVASVVPSNAGIPMWYNGQSLSDNAPTPGSGLAFVGINLTQSATFTITCDDEFGGTVNDSVPVLLGANIDIKAKNTEATDPLPAGNYYDDITVPSAPGADAVLEWTGSDTKPGSCSALGVDWNYSLLVDPTGRETILQTDLVNTNTNNTSVVKEYDIECLRNDPNADTLISKIIFETGGTIDYEITINGILITKRKGFWTSISTIVAEITDDINSHPDNSPNGIFNITAVVDPRDSTNRTIILWSETTGFKIITSSSPDNKIRNENIVADTTTITILPPEDVCPNIPNIQLVVPLGFNLVDGNCLPDPGPDWCPNILGTQNSLPAGMTINSDGDCIYMSGYCSDPLATNTGSPLPCEYNPEGNLYLQALSGLTPAPFNPASLKYETGLRWGTNTFAPGDLNSCLAYSFDNSFIPRISALLPSSDISNYSGKITTANWDPAGTGTAIAIPNTSNSPLGPVLEVETPENPTVYVIDCLDSSNNHFFDTEVVSQQILTPTVNLTYSNFIPDPANVPPQDMIPGTVDLRWSGNNLLANSCNATSSFGAPVWNTDTNFATSGTKTSVIVSPYPGPVTLTITCQSEIDPSVYVSDSVILTNNSPINPLPEIIFEEI